MKPVPKTCTSTVVPRSPNEGLADDTATPAGFPAALNEEGAMSRVGATASRPHETPVMTMDASAQRYGIASGTRVVGMRIVIEGGGNDNDGRICGLNGQDSNFCAWENPGAPSVQLPSERPGAKPEVVVNLTAATTRSYPDASPDSLCLCVRTSGRRMQ